MATSTIENLPSIVEHGTSGIWTYRKWSDGTSECWGAVTWTTTYSSWSGIYYSNESPAQDYPSGLFIEKPIENVTLQCGGGDGWLGANTQANPSKDRTGRYYRMRPTTATSSNATINIYSIGKWK